MIVVAVVISTSTLVAQPSDVRDRRDMIETMLERRRWGAARVA